MYSSVTKIGIIGAGNLARALTKGFVASGSIQLHDIHASDISEEALHWMSELGCNTSSDDISLVNENKFVILTTKPQVVPDVIRQISPHLTDDHLLLSFAAGLNLSYMQHLLPPKTKLARIMTNTSVQFLEGVSSFTLGPHCTNDNKNQIKQLMTSVGYCNEVKEDQLDIITGFVGGGPAYTYCFIEAIADGAVLGGMQRDEALKMATKTVLGAAKTLEETRKHPGELKDSICSAGGTTINGIRQLEKAGFRGASIEAVTAAANRSKELSVLFNANITSPN